MLIVGVQTFKPASLNPPIRPLLLLFIVIVALTIQTRHMVCTYPIIEMQRAPPEFDCVCCLQPFNDESLDHLETASLMTGVVTLLLATYCEESARCTPMHALCHHSMPLVLLPLPARQLA